MAEVTEKEKTVQGEGAEKAEKGKAKEAGINKEKTVVVERTQKERKEGWFKRADQKVRATERPGAARIGLFIFLMAIGAFDIIIKRMTGYEPKTSLLFSVGIGVIFFLAVRTNLFYRDLVIGTFILDVAISQGLLLILPENELKNILIAIKVFIWLILAILLFILEVFNHLAEGEKLPLVADVVLLLIIGVLVFFLFPQLLTTYNFQTQTYDEYWGIAKTELGKVTTTFKETKNTWGDYFSCTLRAAEGEDMDACMKQKKIERLCEEQTEISYDKCLEQQGTLQIGGTEDPSVKQPTKVEIIFGEYFPKTSYRPADYDPSTLSYPAQLKVQNPRAPEQRLELKVSCVFKRGSREIAGLVSPAEFISLEQKEEAKSVLCVPSQMLEGSYTLKYLVDISGLQTTSRLSRAFIGEKTAEEKEELIPKLKRTYFSGQKYLSQAPQEFARLNFGFGEPETNPIIEADDNIILVSTIENLGRGKITAVRGYQINLPGFYAQEGNIACLQKTGEIFLPLSKTALRQTVPLPSCFLSLPPELASPTKIFIYRGFTADLIYDYQLEKEIPIEVKINRPLTS